MCETPSSTRWHQKVTMLLPIFSVQRLCIFCDLTQTKFTYQDVVSREQNGISSIELRQAMDVSAKIRQAERASGLQSWLFLALGFESQLDKPKAGFFRTILLKQLRGQFDRIRKINFPILKLLLQVISTIGNKKLPTKMVTIEMERRTNNLVVSFMVWLILISTIIFSECRIYIMSWLSWNLSKA